MSATHDGWYMLIAYAYEHAEKRIPTYIYVVCYVYRLPYIAVVVVSSHQNTNYRYRNVTTKISIYKLM